MKADDVDFMTDDQVRSLLHRIIESLELAEEEGAFGSDSWQGFLEIEEGF